MSGGALKNMRTDRYQNVYLTIYSFEQIVCFCTSWAVLHDDGRTQIESPFMHFSVTWWNEITMF